jgi:hypothetical protein
MPHPEPNQTAQLADFLTALTMKASGVYPMPVVEAIAQRADARAVESDESR